MIISIKIPKEFEEEFDKDRFDDSLARVMADLRAFVRINGGYGLSGKYEQEVIAMLRSALKEATQEVENETHD